MTLLPSDLSNLRLALADLNGQARGKRLPVSAADKLWSEGARMPLSLLNIDILGEDIEDSPLVFETGDRDGIVRPMERPARLMPWLDSRTALIQMEMFLEDGRPFLGDPRQVLRQVVDRFAARKLTPVVASELEFYLVDNSGPELRPAPSPRSGQTRSGSDMYALRSLDAFDAFFNDLYAGAEIMGIPADATLSEGGVGQFEVNLMHQADALKAADDIWTFKLLAKGLARKHGFWATFMSKPFADDAGNGLHIHFSVLDEKGANIFDNGGQDGTKALSYAINGCLEAMRASMLIFAPHGVSYDRFTAQSHAPITQSWGYENRTTAIRVPGGSPSARRIEHRVAGGDCNPYLLLATILGAAFNGMEAAQEASAHLTGNAYAQDLPRLPTDWQTSIDALESSSEIAAILPDLMIRNLVATKRQELKRSKGWSAAESLAIYLDSV